MNDFYIFGQSISGLASVPSLVFAKLRNVEVIKDKPIKTIYRFCYLYSRFRDRYFTEIYLKQKT